MTRSVSTDRRHDGRSPSRIFAPALSAWAKTTSRLTLAALAFAFAQPIRAADIVTGPVDKAGFQALVDAAADGDTILCLPGLYDFEDLGAVKLTRSLAIVAADPDDPPVFQGKLLGGMGPAAGGTPLGGNTAFAVAGGTEASGITLEGLALTGFNRAVVLFDGFDTQQAGCPAVSERLSNVRFAGNAIDNSNRGLQALGGPHAGLVIEDNQIDANGQAVILLGGGFSCADPFGGGRLVDDTERIFGVDIRDNVVSGNYGVLALHTKNATIRGNQVQAGSVGIDIAAFSPGGENETVHTAQVTGNSITGGFAGIAAEQLGDPGLETVAQVRDNTVQDSFWGVYLAPAVNGIKIQDTAFSGVVEFEALLDEGSHDNEVKLETGERLEDLGADNKVKFQ